MQKHAKQAQQIVIQAQNIPQYTSNSWKKLTNQNKTYKYIKPC